MITPPPKRWDAAEYDRRFGFVAEQGQAILDVLAPLPGERILDLGCGTGELTAKIAARGADVVGLDHDLQMIARARARHPGLRFECADGHTFTSPDGDGTFDAVFSNAALHWMLRPAEVIARVRAALRPAGRFVAEAGGRGNVARIEKAMHQARSEAGASPRPSPWFFASIAGYGRLLEEGGFEPRWMRLFDRPTPLAGGEGGLVEWMNMFASPLLDDLDGSARETVLGRVTELLRPHLFAEGQWSLDYRRLAFVAIPPLTPCEKQG